MFSRSKNTTRGITGKGEPLDLRNGFAATIFLLMIPLTVTLVAWASLALIRSKEIQNAETLCHSLLIPTLERTGERISSLLRLNLQAQTLRLEMLKAKSALALALSSANGPAIAAARTWIKKINVQKSLLIQQQRGLILLGQADLHKGLFLIQKKLLKKNQSNVSQKSLVTSRVSSVRNNRARLAVHRSNSPDPFPEYELSPQFPRRQAVVLTWQSHFVQTRGGFKSWIPNLKKEVQCGVSLKETSTGFQAFPVRGKFL